MRFRQISVLALIIIACSYVASGVQATAANLHGAAATAPTSSHKALTANHGGKKSLHPPILAPQSSFSYVKAAAEAAKAASSAVPMVSAPVFPPCVSILNDEGLLKTDIPQARVDAWKAELTKTNPEVSRAAALHIWLGEWELAKNEQPDQAIWHFRQAQSKVPRANPAFGLAAYDSAISLFYGGAYSKSASAFHILLNPKTALPGYQRRNCALWYRHAAACSSYHDEHAKIGIPEPPRLDPLCAAAALAAALHARGLPYDQKTVLRACRVTGEGSSIQDVLKAAPQLGVQCRLVKADNKGLVALPKPLVAYVENDHFIAVMGAGDSGVDYLCSDCGPWPGGRVHLTWAQWQTMGAGLYGVITKPDSSWNEILDHLQKGSPLQNSVKVASVGDLAKLGLSKRFRLIALASTLLRHVYKLENPPQVAAVCGNKLGSLHCLRSDPCPWDGEPVNLATGEEEYHPVPDLVIYNPKGPAVVWARIYNSLRPGDEPGYDSGDFGIGWSQTYNSNILDPSANCFVPPNQITVTTNSKTAPRDGNIVIPTSYYPTGDVYLSMPNGGTVKATSKEAKGRSFPPSHIDMEVPTGTPLKVTWYPSEGVGYYLVTTPDRSVYMFNHAPIDSQYIYEAENGYSGNIYSLRTITDRNGNSIYFKYTYAFTHLPAAPSGPPVVTVQSGSGAGGNGYGYINIPGTPTVLLGPFLASINGYSETPLLSISRTGAPAQINSMADVDKYETITSATDCYGRTVHYHVGTYANKGVLSNAPQSFQELDHVSQVTKAVCDPIPDAYVYGYQNISNLDAGRAGETVPFLHTVTVPSPSGAGFMKTMTINYDQSTDAVKSVQDGNGNSRVYDIMSGTTTKVTIKDVGNNVMYSHTVGFDGNMGTTSDTDSHGNIIYSVTYDTTGLSPHQPATVKNGNGKIWKYTWDMFGNLLTSTTPGGVQTTFNWVYDSMTFQDTHYYPLGELRSIDVRNGLAVKFPVTYEYYEPSGLIHTITHAAPGEVGRTDPATLPPVWLTTTFTYDEGPSGWKFGNLTTLEEPGVDSSHPHITKFAYCVPDLVTGLCEPINGRPASITEVNSEDATLNRTTHYEYNAEYNLTRITAPDGTYTSAVYGTSGNNRYDQPTTVTVPSYGGQATMNVSYVFPGGPISSVFARNAYSQPIGELDYQYGAEGELISTTTGYHTPITYYYDGAYRVKSVTDRNNNTTTYAYSEQFGSLQSTTYPTGESDHITEYDNAGNPTKIVDARGNEVTLRYRDPDDQLTDVLHTGAVSPNVADPSLDLLINYDYFGRVEGVAKGYETNDAQNVSYEYDTNDIVRTVSRMYPGVYPAQTVSYSYYHDGNRYTMSTPGGDFTYQYDGFGAPKNVVNPFAETTAWGYDPHSGLLKTQTLHNSVVTTYSYNGENYLTGAATTKSGANMASFTGLSYDDKDNLLGIAASVPAATELTRGTGFSYDSISQLTGETTSAGGSTSTSLFNYDPAGNPILFKGLSNNFNSDNQSTAINYDASGNPLTIGGHATEFSADNNMTRYAVDSTNSLRAGYNEGGLRSWKQYGTGNRTFFIYDGDVPVCEMMTTHNYTTNTDTNSVIATNTFGANGLVSRHTSSGTVYYTFDPLGNTSMRLDSSGAVLSGHAFDAYGAEQTANTTNDPYAGFGAQFGNYKDTETGLQLMGHRYYDPSKGRFVNRDPIGYNGGIDLYAYAHNNPVNGADPSGLREDDGMSVEDDLMIEGNATKQAFTIGSAQMAPELNAGSPERRQFAGFVRFLPGVGWIITAAAALTGCDYLAGTHEGPLARALDIGSILAPLARGFGPMEKACQDGCFVAGTQVQMANGTTKPIEQIKEGDRVKSRDEESGKDEDDLVNHVFTYPGIPTITLHFSNGQAIETTVVHPFYEQGKGFVPAGQLAIGNAIVTRAGPPAEITSIDGTLTGSTVYNFEVDGDHTYFVGEKDGGVWVHNANLCDIYVIGRRDATRFFSSWPYHKVLNVKVWSPAINDAWIQQGIAARATFRLASPINMSTLRSKDPNYPLTIYFRELKQLRAAGYRKVGDFMFPP